MSAASTRPYSPQASLCAEPARTQSICSDSFKPRQRTVCLRNSWPGSLQLSSRKRLRTVAVMSSLCLFFQRKQGWLPSFPWAIKTCLVGQGLRQTAWRSLSIINLLQAWPCAHLARRAVGVMRTHADARARDEATLADALSLMGMPTAEAMMPSSGWLTNPPASHPPCVRRLPCWTCYADMCYWLDVTGKCLQR